MKTVTRQDVIAAHAALMRVQACDPGVDHVLLARCGGFDVRLRITSAAPFDDRDRIWVELCARDLGHVLEACTCLNADQAATTALELIVQAQDLADAFSGQTATP